MPLLTFVVVASALLGVAYARLGELFVVMVGGGRISLRRGAYSPALRDEFEEVVKRFPHARGSIRCVRASPLPRLVFQGLEPALEQRLRNVFALHVRRLHDEASVHAPPARARLERVVFVTVLLGIVAVAFWSR